MVYLLHVGSLTHRLRRASYSHHLTKIMAVIRTPEHLTIRTRSRDRRAPAYLATSRARNCCLILSTSRTKPRHHYLHRMSSSPINSISPKLMLQPSGSESSRSALGGSRRPPDSNPSPQLLTSDRTRICSSRSPPTSTRRPDASLGRSTRLIRPRATRPTIPWPDSFHPTRPRPKDKPASSSPSCRKRP